MQEDQIWKQSSSLEERCVRYASIVLPSQTRQQASQPASVAVVLSLDDHKDSARRADAFHLPSSTQAAFSSHLVYLPSTSPSPPPNHTINPHHSTICLLHSVALTVDSLISIQSSRFARLVTPSHCHHQLSASLPSTLRSAPLSTAHPSLFT